MSVDIKTINGHSLVDETARKMAEEAKNQIPPSSPQVNIDSTLTVQGAAADAAAVGSKIGALSEEIANIKNGADSEPVTATVTGATISVNDVSSKKHDIAVKVSGVDDPTMVKVARFSKNLLDVSADKLISIVNTCEAVQESDGIVVKHSAASGWPAAVYRIGDYSLFVGKIIRLYCTEQENATRWIIEINAYDAAGTKVSTILSRSSTPTGAAEAAKIVPVNSQAVTLGFRFCTYSAATSTDEPSKFKNLQLEIGNVRTDYELPQGGVQEAIPSADGTVSGLTSTSPNMNLITNNADAMLEVMYNKKTEENGKAFNADEHADYGLPILYMDGDTSAMNKDNKVTLDYAYGNISGKCTAKWQGSSSLLYPKKNYTVEFDTAFEAVEGWGVHDKYCLKADWVDFSHCRNVVSAKLWATVVKSREGVSEKLSALHNGGAIDGFPCLVVLNDELHGIYNFTIPKDGWLMGMGEGTQEAYVCAEGSNECGNWNAPIVGTDFDLEYVTDEDNADWVQTSLNALFAATNASSIDENYIDTTLAQYMDIASAIDYYIFAVLIGHDDGVLKNYILVTYDGAKWLWSAYDMDLTYGQKYGSKKPSFVDSWTFSGNRGAASFERFSQYHKLMRLLYQHKKTEIAARYKELRETLLSPAVVAQAFYNYGSQIPMAVYAEEATLWKARPNTAVNNVAQIVSWYQDRVQWIDKEVDSWN